MGLFDSSKTTTADQQGALSGQVNQTGQNVTNQASATNPWAPSQSTIMGLLSVLGGQFGNTALTGNENAALTGTTNNAQNWSNTYAPQIGSYAQSLFNGGGATDQAGNVNQNYQNYQTALNGATGQSQAGYNTLEGQLTPYANGSMVGNNPALQAQLDQIRTDVTNQVNGSFAGAGRDFSGANMQTLGRGVASGIAPVLANQYNQGVQNQFNAANALYGAKNATAGFGAQNAGAGYGAGNTTAGIQTGLQQQALLNRGQGVGAAGQALGAQNAGNDAVLQAEAARRGIPVQALGLLAQIGIPIAGLGSQSSGNAVANTANNAATTQLSHNNGTSTTTNNPSIFDNIKNTIGLGTSIAGLFG